MQIKQSIIVAAFLIVTCQVVARGQANDKCANLQSLIRETYTFKPAKLSRAERETKSKAMDRVCNLVKRNQNELIPCLRTALEDPNADPFFLFDEFLSKVSGRDARVPTIHPLLRGGTDSPQRRTKMTIIWRRIDMPGHDSAKLEQTDSQWHLVGTSVFLFEQSACRLDYAVQCDSSFATRAAQVTGWVGEQQIAIRITVDGDQRWQLNDVEIPEIADCVDVDLNFSPITNTLPIRRLGLEIGQEANVRAAWLRFPSFTLEPLDQIYRRTGPISYHYDSGGGSFVRELQVNESGFVTLYPDFFVVERNT